ncbi:MAG: transcriptional repressor [Balneolia bacterium]|nr:transcriptional repressor [Balneolia bacterium]
MEREQRHKEILHNHNLKATRIRLRVMELLTGSDVAMSHAQISELLDDETIDKVTLYRTLNSFVEKGLAHKVATEDRNWLYAIYDDHAHNHKNSSHNHAHFICDDCEKIYCFPIDEKLLSINRQNLHGFEIKQQEIRLHGRCPVCI